VTDKPHTDLDVCFCDRPGCAECYRRRDRARSRARRADLKRSVFDFPDLDLPTACVTCRHAKPCPEGFMGYQCMADLAVYCRPVYEARAYNPRET